MAHFERSSLTMGVTVTGRVSTQYNFGKTRIYIYILFGQMTRRDEDN